MNRVRALCACLAAAMFACSSSSDGEQGAAVTDPGCDHGCLVTLAHDLVSGQSPLSAGARITENGTEIPHSDTWLARAQNVNIHGDYADVAQGTGIVIGTGTDSDGRTTIFGLRLRREGGQTTEVELILAHEGEASLFPPSTPIERRSVFSEIVPPGSRTPASRMKEIANAYFDGIEVDSGANVPTTEDCNRIENGVQITNTERFAGKCNTLEGFDYITEVRERRFPVLDEERGVVVGVVAFYIPGGDYPRTVDGMMTTRHYDPRALFLIEGFKIEAGKVRLIEATMRNMPLGATMGWPL